MLHQVTVVVKSRVKATRTRHQNEVNNLCNKKSNYSKNVNHTSFVKNIVHNMLSYTLTEDEYNALAFGLDHHFAARTNKYIIDIEFELLFFFQSINRYVNKIPDNKISHLRTNLRNICDR